MDGLHFSSIISQRTRQGGSALRPLSPPVRGVPAPAAAAGALPVGGAPEQDAEPALRDVLGQRRLGPA